MNSAVHEQNNEIIALMRDFVDYVKDFYEHLSDYPVIRSADAKVLERVSRQTIPDAERPLCEVYQELLQDVYSNTLLAQHPRSFSCIPSTASLLSWMGDVMTNAFNPHDSCRVNAPAIALIEQKLIRWMCDLAGYPEEGGGLFVSGASMANLTVLTAARDARLHWDERNIAVIYVSEQTHASVSKGLHIIGFDRSQIRVIPADADFRMDMGCLAQAVAEDLRIGKRPFAVVASVGTTNTGSIDPLTEIAAFCRRYDMWMHIDGAFGASALLSEQQRKNLAGIAYSDSLSWDAHKWMMQTYGCGMVMVRNQATLVHSFAAHPEYLRDSESGGTGIEFWDLGPELTRPARCLKLWLTLQVMGAKKWERSSTTPVIWRSLWNGRLINCRIGKLYLMHNWGLSISAMRPPERMNRNEMHGTGVFQKRLLLEDLHRFLPQNFIIKRFSGCVPSIRRRQKVIF